MAKRSPIRFDVKFALPIRGVLAQTSADATASEGGLSSASPLVRGGEPDGMILQIQRFYSFGFCRDRRGTQHSVLLCKRPVVNEFTLDQEFKISGYCSYSYLRNGSMVAGLVFHTDKSRTVCDPMRLVVKGNTDSPSNFATSYNLEKLGVLSFVADDSTTLLVPTEVDSSLVVKAD